MNDTYYTDSYEFSDVDREFKKLMIAINHTKSGLLCFTTPTAYGQGIIVELIKQNLSGKNVAFWDGSKQISQISLSFFSDLTQQNPDANAFVISNFQLFAKDIEPRDNFFYMLNFTRDPLASLKKLFVFGMIKEFAQQISLKAPDFRSFFLSSFHFEVTAPDQNASESMRIDSNIQSDEANRYAEDFINKSLPTVLDWLAEMENAVKPTADNIVYNFLEIWNSDSRLPKIDETDVILRILTILQKVTENQITECISKNEKLRLARELRIIANAYKKLRRYDDESIYLQYAMQIITEIQGEQSLETAGIFEDIAKNYKTS